MGIYAVPLYEILNLVKTLMGYCIYTLLANCKIMDDIFEYKYEISVKVKHQLTDEELNMIKRDFWARLQGYHTECPEQLIGADIEIRGKCE